MLYLQKDRRYLLECLITDYDSAIPANSTTQITYYERVGKKEYRKHSQSLVGLGLLLEAEKKGDLKKIEMTNVTKENGLYRLP